MLFNLHEMFNKFEKKEQTQNLKLKRDIMIDKMIKLRLKEFLE